MKTPPFLLLAALAFWGWQSGLLWIGAAMGIFLESSRLVKSRWDLSDTDLRRIMTFCSLLALAATLFVFTNAQESNGGFQGNANSVGRALGLSSLKTSTTFFRWLPMFLFLFVAAQIFSTREKIPLTAFSVIGLWRSKQKGKLGADTGYMLNVSYPYFMLCLFSSCFNSNNDAYFDSFFWGQSILIFWAMWHFRSKRFGIFVWAMVLAIVTIAGNFGQHGLGFLARKVANYDAQWLARFLTTKTDPMEATTSMGQIGRLKLSGQIVIRLHQKSGIPPDYLREASYRLYSMKNSTWLAGSPRSDFDENPITQERDQTTWILQRDKTNSEAINIACYLDGRSIKTGNPLGLLPLPTGSGRLENLPAFSMGRNNEGAVLVEGPALLIFDAFYGPGKTIDAAPGTFSTTNLDFQVPTNELPALNSVISEMQISPQMSDAQKERAVRAFFTDKFNYSLWQGEDKLATTNETSLTRFLLHSRSGHCEYFATATVLLLREMGIPARYAVGYYVHEKSGSGYVVRACDAHAWCIVWNKETQTWENFDTTPASWVGIEEKRQSALRWISDWWSWIGFQISKLRWGQSNLREYILWAMIPVLLVLLYQIIFKRGKKSRRKANANNSAKEILWPGHDSEFYRLEKALSERGTIRLPNEPLSLWLIRVTNEPALTEVKKSLAELLKLHNRHRFDPNGLIASERERLKLEVELCLSKLKSGGGGGS